MKNFHKILIFFLIILDIISFYLSLLLLVLIRYGFDFLILKQHLIAFTIILPFWLLGFFLNNLYSPITNQRITSNAIKAFIFGTVAAVILFYFNPFLKISPKTNLLIFLLFYFSLFIIFRVIFLNNYLSKFKIKVLVIAPDEIKERILEDFKHLHFFEVIKITSNLELPLVKDVALILISRKLVNNIDFKNLKKDLLELKIPFLEIIDFYEKNLGFIPLEEIDEYWILKEIINPEIKFYSFLKRVIDIFFAFLILIFTLPFIPLICLGIYLSSPGPILFKQKRVGKDNKIFTLYKFRTMKVFKDLGIWAKDNDERIFYFGKILRKLHLDEIPQIINIFKNELSFVGPRPEQVPIVEELNKKIPYFEVRHFVLPGITGWAQVNYKYARSLEESKRKLEYDLYYLKNKSLILDILIILKTIFNL